VKEDSASGSSESSQIHFWRRVYRLVFPKAHDPPVRVAVTDAVMTLVLCVPISILMGVPAIGWPVLFPVMALIGFLYGLVWQSQRNRSGF
jgi:hypothetical protein